MTREALLADEGYRESPVKPEIAPDVRSDAASALVQLGFKVSDAKQWVEQISEAHPDTRDVEGLLRLVLQATYHS